MTHRDDQIAAAAAALDSELADRSIWLGDVLTIAASVVDAVLPQIHTVAELDALYQAASRRTLLVDRDGEPHRLSTVSAHVVEMFGPLTVVWQPS